MAEGTFEQAGVPRVMLGVVIELLCDPDRNSGYVQHFVTALIIPVFKGIWCFTHWILLAEL
jgi:hypothetical protein